MASIRKHRGKWQAQIRRYGYPALSKTFSVREDAIRWAREQDRLADRGEWAAPTLSSPDTTLADVLARYEREVTPKKRCKASEKYHLRVLARHAIAKLRFNYLTPAAICRFRDDRLKSVSSSTVVRELGILGHAIKIAGNEWNLSVQPDLMSKVEKPEPNRPRERRLTDEEAKAIEKAFKHCLNKLVPEVVRFAIATGMRRSEVLSLDWQRINLKTRIALLPITKNGDPRSVPLSNEAVATLERLSKSEKKSRGLVFPISANAFRMAWERIRRRANIKDLHFHDLRHEAISRFFELGLTVPEVQLISGHKDVRMLFRYTHLKPEIVSKKLEKLAH